LLFSLCETYGTKFVSLSSLSPSLWQRMGDGMGSHYLQNHKYNNNNNEKICIAQTLKKPQIIKKYVSQGQNVSVYGPSSSSFSSSVIRHCRRQLLAGCRCRLRCRAAVFFEWCLVTGCTSAYSSSHVISVSNWSSNSATPRPHQHPTPVRSITSSEIST